MKQKDIVIILVVVFVAAILAFAASKILIRDSEKAQQAEVVQTISPDFDVPDKRFFNAQAIDPTLQIQIGDNTNPDPFKGSQGQ